MPRNQKLLVFAVIALVVAGTFSVVLEAEFLNWDDNHNIYQNPRIQELTAENVGWMFTDVGPDIRYKPLTWLVWGMTDALFGQNSKAFHAVNLLLHLVNTGLLITVFCSLGRRIRPVESAVDERRLFLVAAGAAVIWAIHPLRVEPVSWVSCTAHGLCLAFCLLATIQFLRTDFDRSVWNQGSYWWALGLVCLSLLTFPLPLGYGAIFLGLFVYPLKRLPMTTLGDLVGQGTRRAVLILLPFLAVSVVMLGVQLYCRMSIQGTFGEAVTWDQFPLVDRLFQSAYVWMFYLWKTLLPLNLAPVYLDLTELSGFDWPFVASAVAFCTLLLVAIRVRGTAPGLLAIVIAHLGVLVPVLGLTERPHFPGDRYSHIDGAILMAGVFGLVWSCSPRISGRAMGGISAVLIMLLAFLSFRQSLIWSDDRTFFTHQSTHLADGGQRGMAFVRLATAYQQEGDLERAGEYYAAALKTHPGYPAIDLFLPYGMVLEGLGQNRAAARQYQAAIRIEPGHPDAWRRLGMIFLREGEPDLAAGLWSDASRLHSRNFDFVMSFAEGFLAAGHSAVASDLAGKAAEIAPKDPRLLALQARLP